MEITAIKLYFMIFLATTAVYFFLLLILRFFGKRELAQISTVDLILILLLSNSVQNAMVLGDNTLVGGIVAAATLFFWNYVLKLIFYRYRKLDHMFEGQPIMLIYQGIIQNDNLKKLRITEDELEEVIREHGVTNIADVDMAIFEEDGNISVLSYSKQTRSYKKRKAHQALKQPDL